MNFVDTIRSIKEKITILGQPAQLMKLIANKAVDMVLNFIITHPPSALIKAVFKGIEAIAGKSIVELIRQHIPYADKILDKIAGSGPVQGIMKPLQGPVNTVGGMIDQVTDEATGMVDSAEKTTVSKMGSGAKLMSAMGIGGKGGQSQGQSQSQNQGGSSAAGGKDSGQAQAGNKGGGKEEGGGDFFGTIKSGIHNNLMALGLINLKKLGTKIFAAGAAKVANAIRKMLTPKVKFKLGNEEHQLWVEQDKTRNSVMMASSKGTEIEENIEASRILAKSGELRSKLEKTEKKQNEPQVSSNLQDLKQGLQAAGKGESKGDLEETVIKHGGEAGNHLWVEANPLTEKGTAGSPPKENCPGWEHAQDLNKVQDTWVKGHLLNHHLHGPGVAWNLVPLTKKNNSAMAVGPEELAKNLVKEKILYYRTEVTFHAGKQPIMYFPDLIKVSVGEKINNKITIIEKYSFKQDKPPESVENVTYNINEFGRDFLRDKFGIPEVFAKEIIYVRDKYGRKSGNNGKGRFESFLNLQDLMEKYYTNKLDPSTKFTGAKLDSFDNNLAILEKNIIKDKKLEVK